MSMPTPAYHLEPGEKVVPVMVYTATTILCGDVVIKEQIRASTWLRTNIAPDWIPLLNARCILANTTGETKPVILPQAFVATSEVVIFHLMPPQTDPLDYDPNEPNRKMEPVTVLAGPYRIDAFIRLAARANLAHFIDVSHETFTSLYNAEITRIDLPSRQPMRIPYILVRQAKAVFAETPQPHPGT